MDAVELVDALVHANSCLLLNLINVLFVWLLKSKPRKNSGQDKVSTTYAIGLRGESLGSFIWLLNSEPRMNMK